MGKRPRKTNEMIGEIVIDPEMYIANKGSKSAKKILDKTQEVHIEIWFDKHYSERYHHGEDNGDVREGISPDVIKEVIANSISHIFHYSFCVSSFSFINKEGVHRAVRFVIKTQTDFGTLNIVVGFFHIERSKYEVTVYTAMCVDDFRVSDGQFIISLDGESSTLSKKAGPEFKHVDSI